MSAVPSGVITWTIGACSHLSRQLRAAMSNSGLPLSLRSWRRSTRVCRTLQCAPVLTDTAAGHERDLVLAGDLYVGGGRCRGVEMAGVDAQFQAQFVDGVAGDALVFGVVLDLQAEVHHLLMIEGFVGGRARGSGGCRQL